MTTWLRSCRSGFSGSTIPPRPRFLPSKSRLQHAAAELKIAVETQWLPTDSLLDSALDKKLEAFDALWAAPGSPYKSFDGMLRGIEFARRRDWPFLGTCGGCQYTLIECARNVLGIKDADSAENNSGSKNIVIHPVACAVPDRKPNAPKLSGKIPEIRIRPGSYLHSFYKKDVVSRGVLLQLRSESRIRMGNHRSRVSHRGPRGERRGASHRVSQPPVFHRDLVSAAAIVQGRASPIPSSWSSCAPRRSGGRRNWKTAFWNKTSSPQRHRVTEK